jgi:hypothetical protein
MRILVLLGLSNVLAASSVAGPADEIARIYAQAIGGPCATRWDNQRGGQARFRGLPEFNLSLRLSKWLYSVPFPRCGLS